jgi:hypothetical protein
MRLPNTATLPWYRQLWPWLLIAGPATVVVAALLTAWLAVWSDDGIVSDDYYKRGLLINKEIERSGRGEAMNLGAVLRVTTGGAVHLDVSGFADAARPAVVRVKLAHPTRGGHDRTLSLARDGSGSYTGTLDASPQGRWLVTIETDTWRLPTAVANGGLGEVRIGAARAVD